jgi:predicted ABC-type ATPase
MPTIYILAGPNGVGKTTYADRYLPDVIKELEGSQSMGNND